MASTSGKKPEETACLIHGSKTSKGRQDDTGIKHRVTNKVLLALAGQGDYFDRAPCVIIVPILSRQEGIDCNGGVFDSIMMIDQLELYDGEEEQIALEVVCSHTIFTHKGEVPKATSAELNTAIELLQEYTRAILYAQRSKKPR
eukprot:scaffold19910_cov51-Attheya_sp.AAC.2